MIKRFFSDETGLELSEYAVAAALVAIAASPLSRCWATTLRPASPNSPTRSHRSSDYLR